ncbi:MAG: hypothetical protein ACD_73C00317G0003 [uncultured bacterium]|nr:MAG: hypothetical protein ACD_73C00317G0003 [uncultured bacterium]
MPRENLHQMPLRVPASLHEILKSASETEGISLNQYCLYLLARHVPDSKVLMKKKGEDLLIFLEEAHVFQKELDKNKKIYPQTKSQETPLQRYKKIHATH